MKELVNNNVQPKYLAASPALNTAMKALVGIRASDQDSEDATAVIRRMRQGTRLSRLTNQNSN